MNFPPGVVFDSPSPSVNDSALYQARLIHGETSLGLMVPTFRKQRVMTEFWRPNISMTPAMIRGTLYVAYSPTSAGHSLYVSYDVDARPIR